VQSIKLEMQDNQLKIERLENNPNEETKVIAEPIERPVMIGGGMRACTCLGIMMMKLSVRLR